MNVFFSTSAYDEMARELDRWSPREAAFYPLGQLVLKSGAHKSPLDTVVFDDIDRVVIPRVVFPPDEFKHYEKFRAVFHADGDAEAMNSAFRERCLDPVIDAFPRLDHLMLGHSHPFAEGRGWPMISSGGRHSDLGTLRAKLPLFAATGLAFILEILAHKCEPSPLPRAMECGGAPIRRIDGPWYVTLFALTPSDLLIPQDPTWSIDDDHPFVIEALSRPYYASADGAAWAAESLRRLSAAGCAAERRYLSRGWDVYNITVAHDRRYAVCLPPSFPLACAKAYRVVRVGAVPCVIELALPDGPWQDPGLALSDYDLVELARALADTEDA